MELWHAVFDDKNAVEDQTMQMNVEIRR